MKSFSFTLALFALVLVSVCNAKVIKNAELKTNVRALRAANLRLVKTMRAVRMAEKKLRQTNRAIKLAANKVSGGLDTSDKFIDGVFDKFPFFASPSPSF